MSGEFDEKAVFLQALTLHGEAREDFLRRACPTESAQQRVRTLLAHHEQASTRIRHDASTVDSPRTHPERIDEFRIERRLAEGGMGVVYLARDTVLDRPVALKVLAGHLTGSEAALQRFITEARSAAALNHPGIVPVYKLGFDGVNHYIVSELVDGPTLATVIGDERERRREASGTADVRAWQRRCAGHILAIADALEASHRAGIIHRDVKPSNILIDQTHGARLTDFGIARHLSEQGDARVTARIGTCHYMSPEQASLVAAKVDQRSDVFSLGVVMYEALSLERPFEGKDVDQVLRAVIATQPRSLRKADRSIPKDLETICHKALEKQPEQRYQSAGHMAADLRAWLSDRPILARPPGVVRLARLWVRQHARAAAVLAALLMLGVIGGLILQNQSTKRATMGHLVIAETMRGARVTVIPHNADGTMGSPIDLGTAPLDRYLPPGIYRLVFVSAGGQRREASSLLTSGSTDAVEVSAPSDELLDDMVHVPAGTYTLGKEGDKEALHQLRTVQLPAFRIARAEVSNAEYREYVIATGAPAPKFWKQPYDPADDALPVVGISWDDANRYCRWRGVRLPTPNEWEAAARRPNGWVYPWGDESRPDLVRADDELNEGLYRRFARPVESDEDLRTGPGTDLGLYHMASNVQEYTEGVDASRNNGMLIKGRSFADRRIYSFITTRILSGRDQVSYDRGFRVAATSSATSEQ